MGERAAPDTRRSLTYLFSPIVPDLPTSLVPLPRPTVFTLDVYGASWNRVTFLSLFPASTLLTGQGSRSFLCNEIICWLRPRPREIPGKSARLNVEVLGDSEREVLSCKLDRIFEYGGWCVRYGGELQLFDRLPSSIRDGARLLEFSLEI